jgi:peptide/nickel transport system substrate-binding protein
LTKSTALQQGEVDLIDQLPHDQTPILDHATGIVLRRISPIDAYAIIRPNQLYPPFDDSKARQARALAVDQREYASAAFGDQKWWRDVGRSLSAAVPMALRWGRRAIAGRI